MGEFSFVLFAVCGLRFVFHGGRHGVLGLQKIRLTMHSMYGLHHRHSFNEKEEKASTVRWWDWLNDTTIWKHIELSGYALLELAYNQRR